MYFDLTNLFFLFHSKINVSKIDTIYSLRAIDCFISRKLVNDIFESLYRSF